MTRVLIYCLVCAFSTSLIQAATIKRSTVVFVQFIRTLDKLQDSIQTDTVELHSPRNILRTCHHSALNCFKNETSLLRPLQNYKSRFNIALERIRYFTLPPDTWASNSTCPPCTSYKKQSPRTFVTDFRELLQQMNRVYMDNQ